MFDNGTPGDPFDDTTYFHNGDNELVNPKYVFFDKSLNKTNLKHSGAVGGMNNELFAGGDSLPIGDSVLLTNTAKLLFRFELIATGSVTIPEFFNLTIEPGAAFGFRTGPGDDPPIWYPSYEVEGGEITVVSAAGNPSPVPEPSTALIFATGLAALCYRRKQSVSNHHPGTSPKG